MSSFCFAELRKRNLIYQKISAPVFAARGIERKFQPCFFRSLSDISFVIYSMQKINRDKKNDKIFDLKTPKTKHQNRNIKKHKKLQKKSQKKREKLSLLSDAISKQKNLHSSPSLRS